MVDWRTEKIGEVVRGSRVAEKGQDGWTKKKYGESEARARQWWSQTGQMTVRMAEELKLSRTKRVRQDKIYISNRRDR